MFTFLKGANVCAAGSQNSSTILRLNMSIASSKSKVEMITYIKLLKEFDNDNFGKLVLVLNKSMFCR